MSTASRSKKGLGVATRILVAMVLGAIAGFIVGKPATQIQFIGTIWLNIIKMIMVPTVVTMVVTGISGMDNPKTLGRVSLKVVVFYVVTTILATLVGMVVAEIFQPGVNFKFTESASPQQVTKMASLSGFLVSLFSANMFESFVKANMMQLLVISIILGLAIVMLPKAESREYLHNWFAKMSEMCLSVINIAMHLAPIGVFCLMAAAMGSYGLGFIGTMAKLLGTFYAGCAIHFFFVYCLFLWANTGITPVQFMRGGMETFVTAISTCSSAATVPVNLHVAKDNFGVEDTIANFALPLGSSFNQDGGAVLSSVVMLFCAQAIGMQFSFAQLFNILLLTVLVTCGSSGVPGGGIMRLMVVAAAMNLPLEIVAMVGAFYRCFDMGTTSMSVMGDLSATIVVDRWEKKRAARIQQAQKS
ncbi:MAG: dicarboxylate/amino acid:cation symporter [Pyramidobacter sp.]|nr:dicarboxylate/amino acid:cation symporter [Pyramidobacter sp.]